MLLHALLLSLLQAGSAVVKVDSREQGRTFYVDTDRPEIRHALRDVSAPAPAGPIPSWLPPYPGAIERPHDGSKDPVDFGVVVYTAGAPADVVFAHYDSVIQAARVAVTYVNREPGRGGAIDAEDATHQAVVSVSPGPGATAISVNWRPKVIRPVPLAKSARLAAVWYDDGRQILRLRDPATGMEYELGMAAMLRFAHSEALEPSARTDFPPWLAFYPGAKVIVANAPPAGWQPRVFTDMRSYKVDMESTASVADVAAFYRETMERNGLTIVRETKSQDWAYSLEARSADRMHQVYVNVLKRAKTTGIELMDHYTLPR
ncbi:MAG TPA: hypothetical protein VL524_19185 [Gemmatimonadaceae bacterium]|nr:hypothetical protein [Gemmatimonadaceae bacterium]